MKSEDRVCQNCKQNFVIAPEDFVFYEKIQVPAPALCRVCRMQRKMLFRNERVFYRRSCDKCKKSLISSYAPEAPYVVYCRECYTSDAWDPYTYAKEYDATRPFFEQLGELFRAVPKPALPVQGAPNINSDYMMYGSGNVNCYLISNAWTSENMSYSRGIRSCRDSVDVYFATSLENGYEALNVQRSTNIFFSQNITDSLGIYFSRNLANCQNCFGSVNLRNKKYCFFNEELSKEEWARRVGEILGSYRKMEEARAKFEEFATQFPRKENNNFKAQNSKGDYIFESAGVRYGFEVTASENCAYNFANSKMKDCYDTLGFGTDSELLLEVVATGLSSRVMSSWSITDCRDVAYSVELKNSSDCIGSDGLKNAKYCILNKPYEEEEYKKLREHIQKELISLGEYGLFFPPTLAPYAYNETIAQDNFPLTEEDARGMNYPWRKRDASENKSTLSSQDLPEAIGDVSDQILQETLGCSHEGHCAHGCSKAFRLTPEELAFYRKNSLPVPRNCFSCRFAERLERRNPLSLWHRACGCSREGHFHGVQKCPNEFETSYAPERPEIVYCEQCYQAEVA